MADLIFDLYVRVCLTCWFASAPVCVAITAFLLIAPAVVVLGTLGLARVRLQPLPQPRNRWS